MCFLFSRSEAGLVLGQKQLRNVKVCVQYNHVPHSVCACVCVCSVKRGVADLVILRGPGIEGPSQEQLSDHAAQRPHVDGFTERQSQDDLWGSANKSTLEQDPTQEDTLTQPHATQNTILTPK